MFATNKEIVRHFNEAVIEQSNREVFEAVVAADFVNHTTASGLPEGRESLWNTFSRVLRPGLSELKVEILDQVAEADKVTTRKRITALHTGLLLGVAATGRSITIEVMDIVRIENGQYREHWGINSLSSVMAELRSALA